MKLIPD